jgi:hypothetical protein
LGRQGYIVPVSSISTDRYESLQNLLTKRELIFSAFDDRPSRLFDGLEHIRLTIHIIGKPASHPNISSTKYNKWSTIERDILFDCLRYSESQSALLNSTLPKLSSDLELSILGKLESQGKSMVDFYRKNSRQQIFYSRKVGYFLQVLDFEPKVLDGQGKLRPPSEFKALQFNNEKQAKIALCCLNSNLFYWFITAFSDCRHVNKREVDAFPINLEKIEKSKESQELVDLAQELMDDLDEKSEYRVMKFSHDTLTVQCILPKQSKPIIDKIDAVLAYHYGFTDEELDFIINYDIKYRMGLDSLEEDDN